MNGADHSESSQDKLPGVQFDVIRREVFLSGTYLKDVEDPENLLKTGERFARLVEESPFSEPDDPVQIIARSGAKVIARSCLIPGMIESNCSKYRIFWGSGLRVSPGWRRRGIAEELVRIRMNLNRIVGGCAPARTTTNLYRKLNWKEMKMTRCLVILRTRPILEKFIGRGPAVTGALASDLIARFLVARISREISKVSSQYEVRRVSRFPVSINELFQMPCPNGRLRAARSVKHMNLMLDLADNKSTTCLLLLKESKILGYVIVRTKFHKVASSYQVKNFTLGSIKDWRVLDANRIDEYTLMLVGIKELIAQEVDVIESTPARSETVAALRKLGLLTKDSLKLFVHVSAIDRKVDPPELEHPGSWDFTAAEGDNLFL